MGRRQSSNKWVFIVGGDPGTLDSPIVWTLDKAHCLDVRQTPLSPITYKTPVRASIRTLLEHQESVKVAHQPHPTTQHQKSSSIILTPPKPPHSLSELVSPSHASPPPYPPHPPSRHLPPPPNAICLARRGRCDAGGVEGAVCWGTGCGDLCVFVLGGGACGVGGLGGGCCC